MQPKYRGDALFSARSRGWVTRITPKIENKADETATRTIPSRTLVIMFSNVMGSMESVDIV